MVAAQHAVAVLISACLLAVSTVDAAKRFCPCSSKRAPVCGYDSQTYLNKCVAACVKVSVRYNGNCADTCTGAKKSSCVCGNAGFSPVCAAGNTYMNQCSAGCAGFQTDCTYKGVCRYPGGGGERATPRGRANGFRWGGGGFPSRSGASHDYWKALDLSYRFYESMRSGNLPRNNRISWRGNSCQGCKGKFGEDLSGGYYEAGGSYLKMTQIIAYTTGMLGWTVDAGAPGLRKAGQLNYALDAVYWGAMYLVKGHVQPNRMIAQLGHRCTDFRYFGPPELYDKQGRSMKLFSNPRGTRDVGYIDCGANKGSEIAAQSAAALIIAARVFKANKYRTGEINNLVKHATQLYNMAKGCQGSFKDAADPVIRVNHARLYDTTGYKDDLAWAATWMYAYTRNNIYLQDARRFYNEVPSEQSSTYAGGYVGYHADGKFMYPYLHVLLARVDTANRGTYISKANQFLNQYADGGIPRTFRGFSYPFHWGANRVTSNAAFMALFHANTNGVDAGTKAKLFAWGRWTIDYLLGDSGRSYLIGYGRNNPPCMWHKFSMFPYNRPQPDHRWNYLMTYKLGPWTQSARTCGIKDGAKYFASQAEYLFRGSCYQTVQPVGALYGAPMQNDNIVASRDYGLTEPTIDSNAGFTGALAMLSSYFNRNRG